MKSAGTAWNADLRSAPSAEGGRSRVSPPAQERGYSWVRPSSNRDDHLRNHGFLRPGDRGWRLSPAYDLNPTPAEAGGRTLATAIVAGDTRAALELAFETAAYFGIPLGDAREVAAEVAGAVSGWRNEASRFGLPRREQDLMASAFEHAELERFARLNRSMS